MPVPHLIAGASVPMLSELSVDLFVAATGFEERAAFVSRKVRFRATRRIAIGFAEHRDHPTREANDRYYRDDGFEILELEGAAEDSAVHLFQYLLDDVASESPVIVIDYSSMTRAWYGSFLRCLASYNRFSSIRTIFAYTPARFESPPDSYPPNEFVRPVRGFAGFALPEHPSALVLGLGYDPGRALGLYLELDAGIVATFLARPSADSRYERATCKTNADLLHFVPSHLQFEYPLLDFVTGYQRLAGLVHSLSQEAGVVLCPLGPKVFALSCFLVALDQPSVSVWRVSAGQRELPRARRPAGHVVLTDIEWGERRSLTFAEALSADTFAAR